MCSLLAHLEAAQLARLVESDADNLKDAIEGETCEIDIMYLEFAQTAKVAGDTAAADRFEEIRHDEMGPRWIQDCAGKVEILKGDSRCFY